MIRGIHHISLSTRDLDKLLGFYRDLLGLELLLDTQIADNPAFDHVVGLVGAQARGVFLQAGNAYIEIWQFEAPTGKGPNHDRPVCDVGLTHICFDIEDIEATHRVLAAAAVKFVSPPQHLGSVITCYARDPDGNLVELRQGIVGKSAIEIAPEILATSQTILTRQRN
jgi:glyoxylase I family protein